MTVRVFCIIFVLQFLSEANAAAGKVPAPCAQAYKDAGSCPRGTMGIEVVVGTSRNIISARVAFVSSESLRSLAQCSVEHMDYYGTSDNYELDKPGTRTVTVHVRPPRTSACRNG